MLNFLQTLLKTKFGVTITVVRWKNCCECGCCQWCWLMWTACWDTCLPPVHIHKSTPKTSCITRTKREHFWAVGIGTTAQSPPCLKFYVIVVLLIERCVSLSQSAMVVVTCTSHQLLSGFLPFDQIWIFWHDSSAAFHVSLQKPVMMPQTLQDVILQSGLILIYSPEAILNTSSQASPPYLARIKWNLICVDLPPAYCGRIVSPFHSVCTREKKICQGKPVVEMEGGAVMTIF